MTTNPHTSRYVAYQEPDVKPAPILAVGPLAWVRKNLFSSVLDTLLTLVGLVLIVTVVGGLFYWAISQANWFVITRNIRVLMVGTFPLEELWRVNLIALAVAFAVGFTLFAYTRMKLRSILIIGIGILLMAVLPTILQAVTQPAHAYLSVGNQAISSGTSTAEPISQLGFIGREGEVVSVAVAPQNNADEQIAGLGGFFDRSTQALFTATMNRIRSQARLDALQDRLNGGDLLTDIQREELTQDAAAITIPEAITETYQLGTTSVFIEILSGETLEPIAQATLDSASEPLRVTLPANGWYILLKTVAEDAEATVLLETTGIYPMIERNLSAQGGTRVIEYLRLNDGYESRATRPQLEGNNITPMFVTDNQYQGTRPFNDYLRLQVGPFISVLNLFIIPFAGVALVGFGAAAGLMKLLPAPRIRVFNPRITVRSAVTWLWVIVLVGTFVLLYGIDRLDAAGLGGLIARFFWIGMMFFAGMNINRTFGRPLLAVTMILGLVQIVIGEGFSVEFIQSALEQDATRLLLPLLGILAWLGVGYFFAKRGAQSGTIYLGEKRALIGYIISAVLWAGALLLIPLLVGSAVASSTLTQAQANNLLEPTDSRRWGGFLLTVLLTVTSIIASFPLGVGLALGRRSSLPVVKWICTLFIELVRGVPFITILFMAQLLVPLINPSLANVDAVTRAIIGTTLFSAAYLAENVRGGLQSIPSGQEEAAKALGLSTWQMTLFITLPQALRTVLPALVGQCLALFKDTSLVALVGLQDLTGISRAIIAQAEYVGLQSEVYIFIGIIYFVFSYIMSAVSRRIEASGSGAARRI